LCVDIGNSCTFAKVLYRYFFFLYDSSTVDSLVTASTFVPLPSALKNKIKNSYLSKWKCSSSESAVTNDLDIAAVVMLSIVGGIIAFSAISTVFVVTACNRIKRKKEEESQA